MKKFIFNLKLGFLMAMTATLLLGSTSIKAQNFDFEDNGIFYQIISDLEVAVVNHDGPNIGSSYDYEGDIVIPESTEFNNQVYSVTAIGDYAFSSDAVTSVILPNSVTSIGYGAFQTCLQLNDVKLSDALNEIGDYAFADTSLKNITIPASVNKIGAYVFVASEQIENIEVNPGNKDYKSINGVLFDINSENLIYCPPLKTSLTLPASLKEISNGACYGCNQIETISLPSSLTEIGAFAFAQCTLLSDIGINSNLTEIHEATFWDCRSLESIILPEGLTIIGKNAFTHCEKLSSLTFPTSLEAIGSGAFAGCGFSSIIIPSNVNKIEDYAFFNSSPYGIVPDITVDPANQNYISKDNIIYSKDLSAMIYCPTYYEDTLNIPSTITDIRPGVVGYSSYEINFLRLTQVLTAQNIRLLEIIVEEGNPVYVSQGGLLYNKNLTELLACPGGIYGDINIPNTVTEIPSHAFASCSKITKIVFPDDITEIGTLYLGSCYNLETVVLPQSLISLDDLRFYSNNSLQSVILLSNNVPTLGFCIGVPSNVNLYVKPSLVGDFKNSRWADSFSQILPYIDESDNSGDAIKIGDFYYILDKELLTATVTYESDESGNYSGLIGEIIIPSKVEYQGQTFTVTSIGDYAFANATNITNIILPETITSIGQDSFSTCLRLENIDLSDNLIYIGYNTFSNCSSLKQIYLPKSVVPLSDSIYYPSSIFTGCYSLKSIEVEPGNPYLLSNEGIVYYNNDEYFTLVLCPIAKQDNFTVLDGVTYIGVSAFAQNEYLTELTLPSTVTVIQPAAFSQCKNLSTIELSNDLTYIGYSAFAGCENLSKIILPSNVNFIGQSAFTDCMGLTEVVCYALDIPTINSNVFYNINSDAILYVYDSVLNDYLNSDWAQYFSQILPISEVPEPEIFNNYSVKFTYDENDIIASALITWDVEANVAFNTLTDVKVTAIKSGTDDVYPITSSIKDNVLILDLENLTAGVYTIMVPEGYVFIGENGINSDFSFTITVETSTGIAGVSADAEGGYKVYNLNGHYLLNTKDVNVLKTLPKGVYIINGKKVAM